MGGWVSCPFFSSPTDPPSPLTPPSSHSPSLPPSLPPNTYTVPLETAQWRIVPADESDDPKKTELELSTIGRFENEHGGSAYSDELEGRVFLFRLGKDDVDENELIDTLSHACYLRNREVMQVWDSVVLGGVGCGTVIGWDEVVMVW